MCQRVFSRVKPVLAYGYLQPTIHLNLTGGGGGGGGSNLNLSEILRALKKGKMEENYF